MDETGKLIRAAHGGDKDARDRLVSENMGLVWSVAKRFAGRGYEMEDLFQIGCIGLIKAIDKFDLAYEVKFSTYAVPMIMGEIKRFLRDDGMIKVSRVLKETAMRAKSVQEELREQLGREPGLEEIAKAMEICVEELAAAMESGAEIESLQKTIYQGDGNSIHLMDRLEDERDDGEKVLDRMLLKSLMDGLGEQERQVMVMRYYKEMTQTQVAKAIGTSQVQVSRMEKRILKSMREKL